MTAQGIRTLVRRLFQQGPLGPVYEAAGRRVSVDEIERQALLHPGFLGQLVVWFSDGGQPLPEFITHPALVRASRFLQQPDRPDPDVKVAWANALNLPGSESQRDALRAVLICQSTTLESAATLLGADLEVVSLFEALYWNVLDRKLDRPYIARLCGRIGRSGSPGGVQSSGALGPVLLRVAYELESPQAVLAKAGVLPLNDPLQIQTLLQRLRSNGLASAAVGVAMAKISDEQNPELQAALRIIAAMKKAKAKNQILTPSISIPEGARLVMDKLKRTTTEEELRAAMIYAESLAAAQRSKDAASGASGSAAASEGQPAA